MSIDSMLSSQIRKVTLITLIATSFCCTADADMVVGDRSLLPNTANQTFSIEVTGGESIEGLNFNIQVADGGPEAGNTIDGPAITAVDIVGPGTIFNSNNTGQAGGSIVPQVFGATTTTAAGTVTATGTIAFVTIDTTGFGPGTGPWNLIVSNTLNGPTDYAGISTSITDGTLTVVPEPSSYLFLGIAGCAVAGFRLLKKWKSVS